VKKQRQGGFLISKIHQASARIFARILRENHVRLRPAQGRVMFVLWREGPMPITELCRRTSLGKSTLTGMLDRLERDGYARRVRSEEDRRVILIEAAARDAKSQRAFVKVSETMTAIFYRGFSDKRISRFEKDLAAILNNLMTYGS
jgi:MarR family transcriptional regulator, organic hydroperoxide resistance regulator